MFTILQNGYGYAAAHTASTFFQLLPMPYKTQILPVLYTSPLRRTASIVRNRSHITDAGNLQAAGRQSPDCSLTS